MDSEDRNQHQLSVSEDIQSYGSQNETPKRHKRHRRRYMNSRKHPQHPNSRVEHAKIRHPVDQSFILSVLATVSFTSCSIILGSPVILLMSIVVAIVSSLRELMSWLIVACSGHRAGIGTGRCSYGCQYLTPLESLWYEDPLNIVHTVVVLEKRMTWMQVKRLLYHRVLDARLPQDDNILRYPRFSQKIIKSPYRNFWCHDTEFDVNNHVFTASMSLKTDDQISDFVTRCAAEPLSRLRPLWEVFVSADDENKTVLVIRTHSCIADGITFVKMLVNSLADSHYCGVRSGCGAGAFRLKPRFGGTTYPINFFRALIVGPLTILSWLFCLSADRNIIRGSGHVPSGQKNMIFSPCISLTKIRRIKQVTRCRYNDVMLALLSGSLRNYLQYLGVRAPGPLRTNIPVDLRLESDECSRRVSADMKLKMSVVNVALPTNVEGTIPRLWQVHRDMDTLKSSADAVVMYGAMHYLYGLLPQSWSSSIFRKIYAKQTVQVVNLPGPETSLYFDSHRVQSVVYWAPSIVKNVPLSISMMTYGDSFRLAISSDNGAIPHPQVIIDEYVRIVDVVANLLANRRIPGEHRKRSYTSLTQSDEEIAKVHPIEDLQQRLHDVQEELHDITGKLEAATPDGSDFQQLTSTQKLLSERMEDLKKQFSAVLEELRRRKSLAEGVEFAYSEEGIDGPLRKHRKRALSTPNAWKQSVAITTASSNTQNCSATSTARPLQTIT